MRELCSRIFIDMNFFYFLSFLNPVTKTVSVSQTYEKTLKFCVLGIFSFNFDEILWGNYG